MAGHHGLRTVVAYASTLDGRGAPIVGGADGPLSYPDDNPLVLPHDTIPNFAVSANILSVANGNWSNPATWDLNRVPEAGDVVGIQRNTIVIYDVNSAVAIEAVGVAGNLYFRTDVNTKLVVQHLMVYGPDFGLGAGEYGHLRIGTKDTPVEAGVLAEIVFSNVAIDVGTLDALGADPAQYGNGLLYGGRVTMHGAVKTSWLRLGDEPEAGHTSFTLSAAATGWAVGDLLAVPDTRHLDPLANEVFSNYVPKWETRAITSMSGGNTVANFTSALANDHWGGEHNYTGGEGTGEAAFYPHVGNLTHNVLIRSENGAGVRGHTFCTHRAKRDIRYVEFREMGRTTNGELSSWLNASGATISSISNTAPIVVTLNTDHMVLNGEQVKIVGATGNTAANGTWTVTWISSSIFSLNGSTGNGAYAGGATITHIGTQQIGRYSEHDHHLQVEGLGYDDTVDPLEFKPGDAANTEGCDGPSARLCYCSFHDPNPAPPTSTVSASKWFITIHDTHHCLYLGNVIHHAAGSGVMTEEGSESFNVIWQNLVMNTLGDVDQRKLDGRSGVGYTFRGFNNHIRGNVAAGCAGKFSGIVNGSGYYYATGKDAAPSPGLTARIPMYQGADTHDGTEGVDYTVEEIEDTPIREFKDNESYGAISTGGSIWFLGHSTAPPAMAESLIQNFKVWHCWEEAFFGYPANELTFDGPVFRADPGVLTSGGNAVAGQTCRGFTFGDYDAENITIRNADIRGFIYGVHLNTNVNGTFRIEDSYISAILIGIGIQPHSTPGTGSPGEDHETVIANVVCEQFRTDVDYLDLVKQYTLVPDRTNLRVKDVVTVIDWQGVAADNFRLYYDNEQTASFVMPISTGSPVLVASPEAGLTNAQNYVKYHDDGTLKVPEGDLSDPEGCCVGGVIAPGGATTRSGIDGLIEEF